MFLPTLRWSSTSSSSKPHSIYSGVSFGVLLFTKPYLSDSFSHFKLHCLPSLRMSPTILKEIFTVGPTFYQGKPLNLNLPSDKLIEWISVSSKWYLMLHLRIRRNMINYHSFMELITLSCWSVWYSIANQEGRVKTNAFHSWSRIAVDKILTESIMFSGWLAIKQQKSLYSALGP